MAAHRLLVALLALLLEGSALAASEFQLWTEVGVDVKLAKRLRLELTQHARFDKDATATESFMPELAVSYRPIKLLRLRIGYRYIGEPIESLEETYIDSWHRFFADVQLRYRIAPVRLVYRLRFDEKFGWPWDEDGELVLRHTVRNLLGIEVRALDWLAPFLSGELFLRIDDPDGVLHKWRLTAGLDFPIGDHTLSLCYRMEDRLDEPDEPTAHILGLGYHVAL